MNACLYSIQLQMLDQPQKVTQGIMIKNSEDLVDCQAVGRTAGRSRPGHRGLFTTANDKRRRFWKGSRLFRPGFAAMVAPFGGTTQTGGIVATPTLEAANQKVGIVVV
ncbi:MAG: hypothetical protein PVG19_13140, partial [Desulfobacterales bacterium]